MPAARHRIVERGKDSEALHRFAMNCAFVALLPFAFVLGLDLFLAVGTVSARAQLAIPIAVMALALGLWYGIAVLRGPRPEREEKVEDMKLEDKIVQVLTEARVVLPGAQALVGFQLAITLMDAYEKLPRGSKDLHLLALVADILAVIFLMAPSPSTGSSSGERTRTASTDSRARWCSSRWPRSLWGSRSISSSWSGSRPNRSPWPRPQAYRRGSSSTVCGSWR